MKHIFQTVDFHKGYRYFVGQDDADFVSVAAWCNFRLKTVSRLLASWRAGDEEALREVVPLVYDELRRVAHRHLQKERPAHTLQSAALVHEAYIRLDKQGAIEFQNREHFLAICAQLMRQILVEYARSRNAAKRAAASR